MKNVGSFARFVRGSCWRLRSPLEFHAVVVFCSSPAVVFVLIPHCPVVCLFFIFVEVFVWSDSLLVVPGGHAGIPVPSAFLFTWWHLIGGFASH